MSVANAPVPGIDIDLDDNTVALPPAAGQQRKKRGKRKPARPDLTGRRSRPLTQGRLRTLLAYDPTSEAFTYLRDHHGGRAGDRAGARIMIDGREYAAKRLAALYMTGRWPPPEARVRRKPRVLLSAERLREVLTYDPKTGHMTWRVDRPRRPAGSEAGTPNGAGYMCVSVDGERYRRSRLAFLYMTGRWPVPECDHRNGIVDDDSWGNLREATVSQNRFNRSVSKRSANSCRALGVSLLRNGKYQAAIRENGKTCVLGRFDTEREASAAYEAAAERLHGEFAVSQRGGESDDYVSTAIQRKLGELVMAEIAAEAEAGEAA